MAKDIEIIDPTRRKVLISTAASPLLLLPLHADAGFWRYIKVLTRLTLARFISGLIYDVAKTVVLNYLDRNSNGSYASYRALPTNEQNFAVVPYKKAVIEVVQVRLGVSDEEFEAYRNAANVVLSKEDDLVRFERVHRFLMDNNARLASYGNNSSYKVTGALTPDGLFNSEYMVFNDKSQEWAYRNLLEKTEVTAFDEWVV